MEPMSDRAWAAITTLRYDSSCGFQHLDNEGPSDFYRLGAHIRRLVHTATAAGWKLDGDAGWSDTLRKTEQVALCIRLAASLATTSEEGAAVPQTFNAADLATRSTEHGGQEDPQGIWRVSTGNRDRFITGDFGDANITTLGLTSVPLCVYDYITSGFCHVLFSISVVNYKVELDVTDTGKVRLDMHPPGDDENLSITLVRLELPAAALTLENLFPKTLLSPSEIEGNVTPRWRVRVAKEQTPIDIHTQHKTSNRQVYNHARLGLQPSSEILLLNGSGEIMDASITTPYFWKNSNWVTPATACGGQKGVSRAYALGKGLAIEGTIEQKNVASGDLIWISNGLQGFHVGIME